MKLLSKILEKAESLYNFIIVNLIIGIIKLL
jgi:hypothetical protein